MTETTTPEVISPGVGAQLAQARQAQGLSLGEMARQLKLSVKQVDALERDDYSNFPGTLWARGFLRNYAKSLGLNADALIEKSGLAGEVPGSILPGAGTPLPADATRERRRTAYLVVAFVVLGLFVLGLLGQRASTERSPVPATAPANPAGPPSTGSIPAPAALSTLPPSLAADSATSSAGSDAIATGQSTPVGVATSSGPAAGPEQSAAEPGTPAAAASGTAAASAPALLPPVAPQSGPVPGNVNTTAASASSSPSSADPVSSLTAGAAEVPPAADAASPKPRTLRFTFTQSVEVDVTDANGAVLLSKLQAAGTEKAVRGIPPFSVSLGNVHAVKLAYRGREVDLISRGRNGVAKLTLK